MCTAYIDGMAITSLTPLARAAGPPHAKTGFSLFARLGPLVLSTTLLAGCSPGHLLLNRLADELAVQGQAAEEDLVLARDASAFYLKLSESLLRRTPGHLPLAEAVAGGFTQYAYAFVAFEADVLGRHDASAAQRLRQRAARLYARAHGHAMSALQARQAGFLGALASGEPLQLATDQVAVAYWAAASWAAWIALSTDQPELVADLPLAVRLAGLAYALEPAHGAGALASLMGTLEAARPGGSLAQAQTYFALSQAAAAGRSAGVFVSQAEAIALPAGDRVHFEALLRQALFVSDVQRDLGNQAMRQRAQWLLATADDLF